MSTTIYQGAQNAAQNDAVSTNYPIPGRVSSKTVTNPTGLPAGVYVVTETSGDGVSSSSLVQVSTDVNGNQWSRRSSAAPSSWSAQQQLGAGITGVTSFNARVGGVVSAPGDYDTTQVTNASAVVGATASDAMNTLNTGKISIPAAAANDVLVFDGVNWVSTSAHPAATIPTLSSTSQSTATLAVTGGSTLNGGTTSDGLTVTGPTALNAGLTVTGGSTALNAGLTVAGGSTLNGGLFSDGIIAAGLTVNGGTALNAGVTVTGGTITDTISVTSGGSLNGGITSDGLTVNGTGITTTGGIATDTLSVTGGSTLNGGVSSDGIITAGLTVTGGTALNAGVTISGGSAVMNAGASVTGGATTDTLTGTTSIQTSGSGNFLLNGNPDKPFIIPGGPAFSGVFLVNGAVTVPTTAAFATSIIFTSNVGAVGTPGTVSVGNIVPGVSFDLISTSATDNSLIGWLIVQSA